MRPPQTQYVNSGGYDIAYQVVGEGPVDVGWLGGFATNIDAMWDVPEAVAFMNRMAEWCRLIVFDKRGTGVSERVPPNEMPTLEERMSDLGAVLDAVGSQRTALIGDCEGGALAALYAASHPDRVTHLVLSGAILGPPDPALVAEVVTNWGTGVSGDYWAPSIIDSPGVREDWGRWERSSVTRSGARTLFEMAAETHVRAVLPAVTVPTLVLHRRGDRVVPIEHGREAASLIDGCVIGELPGDDHTPWFGDSESFLSALRDFLLDGAETPRGERVLATLLFTDVVGSTELAQRLGDAAWQSRLVAHDDAVVRAVDRFRGQLIKTTGDGALATFDRPSNAVRCALSIVRQLSSSELRIRCGAHTGEFELRGSDVDGIAVHIAARVMDLAGPDEVLVSRTVKDLMAGSDVELEPRGGHELRGVEGVWELFSAGSG
jgi:class 3 adenylate cyclase/pimeloyl-ACP methyl ester carboxylesterase